METELKEEKAKRDLLVQRLINELTGANKEELCESAGSGRVSDREKSRRIKEIRNNTIRRRYRRGESLTEIAKDYGLSEARAMAIGRA